MVPTTAEKISPMKQASLKADGAEQLDQNTGRKYESRVVSLDLIDPVDGRDWALQQKGKSHYLKGWEKLLMRVEAGEKLPSLVVTADQDRYRMDPTPLGGDLGNSLALLTALRAAGKRQWPALVVVEPIQKIDTSEDDLSDDDEEDIWTPTQEQKKALRDDLKTWAETVILAILIASRDEIPGLVQEGATWGGAYATPEEVLQTSQEVLQWQQGYLGRFQNQLSDQLEQILSDSYGDATAFRETLDSMFNAAESRAELYATAGGNKAWFDGLLSSMGAGGTKGGIWVCTFGPGSCQDCIALHGQYMTRAELADTKGNTQCNGACNCGVVPADDPEELSPEELAAIDENPGDGLE